MTHGTWASSLAAIALVLLARPATAEPALRIDADYPGGNIRVVASDGQRFRLAPDLRDIQAGQWWFYFNFRLRGPANQPVECVFVEKNPIGPRGPVVSTDGGATWKWLGDSAVRKIEVDGKPAWSFPAVVPAGATEARYAFAPPYLAADLQKWLDRHKQDPALRVAELCRSRQGRGVEVVRAGCIEQPRGLVLLTARHHACESMASYAQEGLLSAVLADDDLGRRWRKSWQVVALPFADKDGVETGDQGKNRAPHDHNRDYNAKPLYPEVDAWMKLGQSLSKQVVFSLDMHCPHIRGKWNDRVYFVGGTGAVIAEKDRAFIALFERVARGPLPFRAAECYLAAGTDWNVPASYAAGRSNGNWARTTFPDARFAGTIEIAYADALGAEVNADSARALGRDLAEAIVQFLETPAASK